MKKEIPLHPFFDQGEPKEERPVVKPGETPKDIPESPEHTEEQEFHLKDTVKVRGSDMKWRIYRIDEEKGLAQLEREGFNPTEHTAYGQKMAPLKDLEKVIEPDFKNCNTPEELYAEITRVGGVQGSKKFYTAKELIDLIQEVEKNPLEIDRVTNTNGLRDRVIELFQG